MFHECSLTDEALKLNEIKLSTNHSTKLQHVENSLDQSNKLSDAYFNIARTRRGPPPPI